MDTPKALGHRAPLLWLGLPLAVGVALAHSLPVAESTSLPRWCAVAIISIGLGAWADARGHTRSWAIALTFALIATGGAYHELRRERLPSWDILELPEREARLIVIVERLFEPAPEDWSVSFIGRIVTAEPHLQDLEGQRLHVSVRRESVPASLQRGATLDVVGQLTPLPARSSDPGFTTYLIDSGHNFRLLRGRLLAITRAPSPYAQFREQFKARAATALTLKLDAHPDLAGALRAMLLGERHGLTDADENRFVRSGTMHLFAISGLHIGVIAALLYGGLRVLRLPRWAATLIGTLVLAFYVDLIGGTPSAVRAWLMVCCVQIAYTLRAPRNPIAAIAASALLVLLFDPMQLFSAGFQMSYGIVFALLLYGLPLGEYAQHRWRLWPDLPEPTLLPWQKLARLLWANSLTTFALAWSAATVGLISGVAFFGWFTPLSLVANLILIPVAALAIMSGFLAIVCGLGGLTPWAVLFNHSAAIVLWFVQKLLELDVTGIETSVPAAFRHASLGPIGLGLVLITMVHGYSRKWDRAAGGWWSPALVTALVLVTGARLG